MSGEVTVTEALATVDAAIDTARDEARETADDITLAVIESAEANIDDATRAAEQLAQAAMMTTLGGQIEALRQELSTWQSREMETQAELSSLKSQLTEVQGQMSAIALLQTAPETSLSIQQPLQQEVAEATEAVAEMLPESLSGAVESPVLPEPVKVRKARLI